MVSGIAGGTPIPPADAIINQGGRNLTTSGTQITQPLTNLFKVRRENDLAQAELKATREKAQLTGNNVALAVHQVYYEILIAQAHRSATESRIKASESLQSERVEQVKFGSALEQESIDSRAQLLQAKQELLTTDFQLTDLKLKLNDLIGLPLATALDLDPGVPEFHDTCRREECVTAAEASHPEILAAHAELEKAQAAVGLAKTDIWVPDVEAFARYSYQENVPFLARNFGTFGVHFGYDLFDSGKKHGILRERQAQLSASKREPRKVERRGRFVSGNGVQRTGKDSADGESFRGSAGFAHRVAPRTAAGTNTGSGAELAGRHCNGSGIRCQGASAAVTDGLPAGP